MIKNIHPTLKDSTRRQWWSEHLLAEVIVIETLLLTSVSLSNTKKNLTNEKFSISLRASHCLEIIRIKFFNPLCEVKILNNKQQSSVSFCATGETLVISFEGNKMGK